MCQIRAMATKILVSDGRIQRVTLKAYIRLLHNKRVDLLAYIYLC